MKSDVFRPVIPVVKWTVDESPVFIRRYSPLKLPTIVQLRSAPGDPSQRKSPEVRPEQPGPHW